MIDKLKEVIAITFSYYSRGQSLQDAVLKMYAEDLADLDPVECILAYERFRKNPANKTFPLPAQIRELVAPEQFVSIETKARETAARICAAIPKFGFWNGLEAKAFIGPEGWDVVQRQGGWAYLCEHMGVSINPTSFQAQVRDQLEGVFRYGRLAVEDSIGAISESAVRRGELQPAKGILALIPEKPDGGAA